VRDEARGGQRHPADRPAQRLVDVDERHRHTGVVADDLQRLVAGAQPAGEDRHVGERAGEPLGQAGLVEGAGEEEHDRHRQVRQHRVHQAASDDRPGCTTRADRRGLTQS
jgi:hypothetical protein